MMREIFKARAFSMEQYVASDHTHAACSSGRLCDNDHSVEVLRLPLLAGKISEVGC